MRPPKKDIEGLDRYQISENYGVCLRTAVRWQKHYDLFQSKIGRLNQNEANKIRECHNLGWSPKDCEAAFGRSLTTIYRVLNNQIYPQNPQTANVSVSYNPKKN